MPKLIYEKNGKEKTETFVSYYEAVRKKNKLLKQGFKVAFENKETCKVDMSGRRTTDMELIDSFLKKAKIRRA